MDTDEYLISAKSDPKKHSINKIGRNLFIYIFMYIFFPNTLHQNKNIVLK